jgi:hypothetical protein
MKPLRIGPKVPTITQNSGLYLAHQNTFYLAQRQLRNRHLIATVWRSIKRRIKAAGGN